MYHSQPLTAARAHQRDRTDKFLLASQPYAAITFAGHIGVRPNASSSGGALIPSSPGQFQSIG
jgi:hypothetical protein